MHINVNDILKLQSKLDATIHNKHHVNYKSVYEELKLALLVELGELANEVKSFKFWSVKDRSAKDIVLEEYVDGIHFIGSLCLANNIEGVFEISDHVELLSKKETTKLILKLFNDGDKLNSKSGIIKWYEDYLSLGYGLGFNIDEIKQAYFSKNKINFDRQENNY